MRKIVVWIVLVLVWQPAIAEKPPAVGLWEQLIAGDRGDGSPVNTRRIDILFIDQKIDENTRFSGLFAADIKPEILCCVEVNKNDLITLPNLLKKYPWDQDTADHIKKIAGWKYIYEARLVDSNEQNARMRTLVRNLTIPPSLSPYSAPVIAGKIGVAKIGEKFKVDNADVTYVVGLSKDNSVISYKFSINGKLVTFSEEMFPAE